VSQTLGKQQINKLERTKARTLICAGFFYINMETLQNLKKEIETLQKKCLDIFNPNMMGDLEQLIFKRKQVNYILSNQRKGK
jgi:uncharacterized membrane protein (DUF106 family)